MNIKFEYDQNKSLSNKQKYGIDFEEVQELFSGIVAVADAKNVDDEVRFSAIGKVAQKFYIVIYTYWEKRVRIISARRSRKKEDNIYEKYYS